MNMREIKFRAWDKSAKRMMVVPILSFGHNGEGKTLIAEYKTEDGFDVGVVNGESGEIMQFTGLQDKNGREIYEGDIVRWTSWNTKNPRPEQFKIEQIIWREGSWQVPSSSFNFAIYSNKEIIGNIYENPELLK